MVKEKQGKTLTLGRIHKRLLLNHPDALRAVPLAKKVFPYTMVSFTALYQLKRHLETLDEQGVAGAVVEMGCWKGGCGAFMAGVTSRHIWLFDSFEGLPELTPEDATWAKQLDVTVATAPKEKQAIGLYKATETDVQNALSSAGVQDRTRVHSIKGWFEYSVEPVKSTIGPIALLRLDGDTYASTTYCLETLYDAVVPQGFVVIDDFHLEGCRQALYEFFSSRGIYPEIRMFPYGGRLFWRK